MGQCLEESLTAGFGHALWSIAQKFVMRYGVGQVAGFYFVPWAIAQDLVMGYGP